MSEKLVNRCLSSDTVSPLTCEHMFKNQFIPVTICTGLVPCEHRRQCEVHYYDKYSKDVTNIPETKESDGEN